jgi:hypothetical protein
VSRPRVRRRQHGRRGQPGLDGGPPVGGERLAELVAQLLRGQRPLEAHDMRAQPLHLLLHGEHIVLVPESSLPRRIGLASEPQLLGELRLVKLVPGPAAVERLRGGRLHAEQPRAVRAPNGRGCHVQKITWAAHYLFGALAAAGGGGRFLL